MAKAEEQKDFVDLKGAVVIEGKINTTKVAFSDDVVIESYIIVQTSNGKKYKLFVDDEYGVYLNASEIKEG